MPHMAMTEKERKDFSTPSVGPKAPKYPYGLQLRLGPEEVEKLNMMKEPSVGSKMMILGMVEVIGVSKSDDDEGQRGFSVELQVTDLELKEEKQKEEQSPEKVIYGS